MSLCLPKPTKRCAIFAVVRSQSRSNDALGLPIQGLVNNRSLYLLLSKFWKLSEGIIEEINIALENLRKSEENFGDPQTHISISWSGARVSMPGMMDTILNLGLNETEGGASKNHSKSKICIRLISPFHSNVFGGYGLS